MNQYNSIRRGFYGISICILVGGCAPAGQTVATDEVESAVKTVTQVFPDTTGQFTNLTTATSFDTTGPFFQSLGTNGRSCATCHLASDAWGLSAAHVQAIFDA